MGEKIITPKHLFYFILFGYVAILIAVTLGFKEVSEGRQISNMIFLGAVFMMIILLAFFHFNRQAYIKILSNNMVDYFTPLKQREVVPLKSVSGLRQIWIDTYLVRINGKIYIFYASKNDVKYFKDLLRTEVH